MTTGTAQDETTRLQLIVARAPADSSCLHHFYPAFSLLCITPPPPPTLCTADTPICTSTCRCIYRFLIYPAVARESMFAACHVAICA